MYKSLAIILAIILTSFHASAQYSIIPEPASITYKETFTSLTKSVALESDPALAFETEYVKKVLAANGYSLVERASRKIKPTTIVLHYSKDKSYTPEHYSLTIQKGKITISSNNAQGIFYGIQSLGQILPTYTAGVKIKDGIITDAPRFTWRGLMLDVSRHFFTVNEVKAFIDQMVKYKLNTFHWHLTDDNGWRIEIKSLPRLTEVGAWRVERFGKFNGRKDPMPGEPTPYGGFYTHEEIKEVVRYAAERHITIVPEIDVPGHSMAMLAAYPELSTRKEVKYVNPGTRFSEWFGDGTFKMLIENTLNPSDEKVYEVLDKVFMEVAMLFPGTYIHAGGDEAYHGFWEQDEQCKKFMAANNIKDGAGLQSYFMKRVEKIISSKGKKMIGWDEILEGGMAEGASVMSWRGLKGGIEAAAHGHHVVMSPTTYAYLDYSQGDHSLEFPIYADLTLKKSYEFEPVPNGVDPKFILGAQGNLWTEQVPNLSHAFYMTYPRAFSIAETAWSQPEKKNWSNFIQKVEKEVASFESEGKQICKAYRDVQAKFKKANGNQIECQLITESDDAVIYFTLDQSFPDANSKVYKEAFLLPEGELTIRAITYKNGKPYGRLLTLYWDEINKRINKLK